MLHKNCKKPELKKLRKKLALNQAIKLLDVTSSIESIMAYSSGS